MRIEWTPSGGSLAVLGDNDQKAFVYLEALGGVCLEQVEPIFRASHAKRFARGNVTGDCVFTVSKGHASAAAAAAYFKAEYGRLNGKGTLVVKVGLTPITMANATMRDVRVVRACGVRWVLRYQLGVTTIA